MYLLYFIAVFTYEVRMMCGQSGPDSVRPFHTCSTQQEMFVSDAFTLTGNSLFGPDEGCRGQDVTLKVAAVYNSVFLRLLFYKKSEEVLSPFSYCSF